MWRWEWLLEKATEYDWKLGAELGVKEGRTTEYLAKNGVAMIAVDLWAPQPGNDVKDLGESYEDWDHEVYLKRFWRNTRGCDVSILRMTTEKAAKHVRDGSLDFVFIDADHTYEGVKADIKDWSPKVRDGGAVIGHDWNWPTVRQAVEESISTEITEGPNNCWLSWK